jgi:cob(I)alamin adenosyltransferase
MKLYTRKGDTGRTSIWPAAELHPSRRRPRGGSVARGQSRVPTRRAAGCHLESHGGGRPVVPAYLNRLADLLFVAGRYANHAAGIPDAMWSGQNSR